ncbi:MAG: histidine phosphatase family protein [Rhizobiales bacterium]|nr:histidine phosphatase family protein [Hyphomicrobiales bacterium]
MNKLLFITHPEVLIDANVEVTHWPLNSIGQTRIMSFSKYTILKNVGVIWSSNEIKAVQTAKILQNTLNISVSYLENLGENDRPSTGFVEPNKFDEFANLFFLTPEKSVMGWETAQQAQQRIVKAYEEVISANAKSHSDIAIISHGAVGTLLYCHLKGLPISRQYDQPYQGHYWVYDLALKKMQHGWLAI